MQDASIEAFKANSRRLDCINSMDFTFIFTEAQLEEHKISNPNTLYFFDGKQWMYQPIKCELETVDAEPTQDEDYLGEEIQNTKNILCSGSIAQYSQEIAIGEA